MESRRVVWCIVLAFGLASVASAQDPAPEAFVMRHATLDVSVDYAEQRLAGTMSVELENLAAADAATVSFLLNRLMEASDVRDASGGAVAYTQDVLRFRDDPMRQVLQLIVKLPRAIPPHGHTTLRIDYAGNLTGYREIGWLYVRDHIDTTFTILRSDALAFPTLGGLSDAANRRAPRVDFTYDASVRVPDRYLVATGGAVTRTPHPDGTTTWRYLSGGPSPVLNISIALFDTLVGGGVRLFHFREDSAGARRLMAGTQRALGTLTQWYGPLHSEAHVTITEIPDGWGSQASLVGGIIQSAAAFHDAEQMGELYHELSHLWNVKDTDNPSPRWNEGLASFLQGVLQERVDGWTRRKATDEWVIAGLRERVARDSLLRAVPFIDYGRRGMTDDSYWVGHAMFGALYELVGEEAFNRIVGGYYQRYADGGTTRELVTFSRGAAGRDLSAFFDDWLFTTRWTGWIATATSLSDLADHSRAKPARGRAPAGTRPGGGR
jgi:hypothetical protein